MKRKFYQVTINERTADIDIYGNITSDPYDWWTGEKTGVSAKSFREELEGLDVDTINVYINSYGGEVAEALAIYSQLKRHPATVNTYCDGFACSAATIIFAAGDNRTVGSIALLMIHNCMSYVGYANSEELRKAAEDNDKINQSSIEAYKKITNLSEEEIKNLMDKETWMTASECLEYGFATAIADAEEPEGAQQSVQNIIRNAMIGKNEDDKTENNMIDEFRKISDSMKDMKELIMSAIDRKPEKCKQEETKKESLVDVFTRAIKEGEKC